ncbi:hypothetical protein GGX14DRAFT_387918 [Mycena pura]|uniref:Uncharacterized protein n=1 Tax=Mycena pura TaxID=153505 RepID=A0AAD7E1N0_9AGAR|nr:hypothetical protein GGX14DRAFT_387918 [Mycena pura]
MWCCPPHFASVLCLLEFVDPAPASAVSATYQLDAFCNGPPVRRRLHSVASSPARSSSGSGGTEQIAITNGMWVWRPNPSSLMRTSRKRKRVRRRMRTKRWSWIQPLSVSDLNLAFATKSTPGPLAHPEDGAPPSARATWLRASRWTASAFLFGRDVRSLTDPHTHSASGSSAAPAHAADPTNAFAAAFQGSQTVTTQRMCLGPALVARRILGQQARAPYRHHARVLDPILAEAVARASASTVATRNENRTVPFCPTRSSTLAPRRGATCTREGIERDYTPTGAAPDIRRLPGDEVLAGAWQWLSVSACESNFPGFHKGGAEWQMTSGQATRWFGLKGVSSNCSENKAAPRTAAAAAVR